MKKKYIIKDIISNEYWITADNTKGFIAAAHHAKQFNSWFDCENEMNENLNSFKKSIYEIVPIYLKLA